MGTIWGQRYRFRARIKDANDVRAVLVYPLSIVLADHIAVGMPHLLGDPID
jgi:hypothetical protein